MRKLREYLKEHKREEINRGYAILGLLWLGLAVMNALFSINNGLLCFPYLLFAVLWLYRAFFKTAAEEAAEIDPRPMAERLREAFAELTSEELQRIIDDKLRAEETKAVARELLEMKSKE